MVLWRGGRRKEKGSGQTWRVAGQRWAQLPVTGGLLHPEWNCPTRNTQCVSFQQDEDTFMVLANVLVVPPEEEGVVCDASKAGQCSSFICRVARWAVQCPSM